MTTKSTAAKKTATAAKKAVQAENKAAETFPVRVLVKIRDKHTRKVHNPGEILEVTQERFDEIMAVRKDLVEKVEQKEPEAEKEPEQGPEEQPEAEKEPEQGPEEQPEAEKAE